MSQQQRVCAPKLQRTPSASLNQPQPGSRTAVHDERWPAIAFALAALHERKRFSVRIVDADCGAGCLLLHALRHARALGFTAIEGRGIDGSPALIGRARAEAGRLVDPAVGVVFENKDVVAALRDEQDFPADIVLWRRVNADTTPAIVGAVQRAGRLVIGNDDAPSRQVAA